MVVSHIINNTPNKVICIRLILVQYHTETPTLMCGYLDGSVDRKGGLICCQLVFIGTKHDKLSVQTDFNAECVVHNTESGEPGVEQPKQFLVIPMIVDGLCLVITDLFTSTAEYQM